MQINIKYKTPNNSSTMIPKFIYLSILHTFNFEENVQSSKLQCHEDTDMSDVFILFQFQSKEKYFTSK